MTLESIYKHMLLDHLQPTLTNRGFVARSDGGYTRSEQGCRFRIYTWMSIQDTERVGSIFATASVCIERVWKLLRRYEGVWSKDAFSVAGCGGLVTTMLPEGMWPSWSLIREGDDPDIKGAELARTFEDHVFPFLSRHCSLDIAIAYWTGHSGPPALAAAAALALAGRVNEALAHLDEEAAILEREYAESERPGDLAKVEEVGRFRRFLSSEFGEAGQPSDFAVGL